MDIYSDLGKFVKNVVDDQDKLFKLMAGISYNIKKQLYH